MNNQTQNTEVLFQKLGSTWYVFAELESDFIYSALPEGVSPKTTSLELYEVIEDHLEKVAKHQKKRTVQIAA